MNKTLNYYFELYLPKIIGIVVGVYFYFHPTNKFMFDDTFFDKILVFSTTLFGFLLAVLTLLIQSNSKTVEALKEAKAFPRLIVANKHVVYLSGMLALLSLLIISVNEIWMVSKLGLLKLFASFSVSILIILIIDTTIFLIIFYRIILNDARK